MKTQQATLKETVEWYFNNLGLRIKACANGEYKLTNQSGEVIMIRPLQRYVNIVTDQL